MADTQKRRAENVSGSWFVRESCINCDAVRQVAPQLITEVNGKSAFIRQPVTEEERRLARQALLACPVGAIGVTGEKLDLTNLYPEALAPGVSYCGFNSPKSFGANAFFVQRAGGNCLIDSPRFAMPLVRQLEALGGLQDIFLTHRDHPAESDRYAAHFGARVWIHQADCDAAPWATHIIAGTEPQELVPGLLAIPLPGHTQGSVSFLLDGMYLFSGDSLYWSRARQDLSAFRRQCWYDWRLQADSLERLAREHTFTWVLAGHGDRRQLASEEMHARTLALSERMRRDDDFWRITTNDLEVAW